MMSGKKSIKKVIICIAIVGLAIALFSLARYIVGNSESSKSLVENSKSEKAEDSKTQDLEEREEVETAHGTKLKKSGSIEDRVVQCVYDYFRDELPDSEVFSSGYEMKNVEDGEYCVEVGDWYVFCKEEYSVTYPYMVMKSCPLSEYEQSYIDNNGIDVEYTEDGGVLWYV